MLKQRYIRPVRILPLSKLALERPELSEISRYWNQELAPYVEDQQIKLKRMAENAAGLSIVTFVLATIPLLAVLSLLPVFGMLNVIAFVVAQIVVFCVIVRHYWTTYVRARRALKQDVADKACAQFGLQFQPAQKAQDDVRIQDVLNLFDASLDRNGPKGTRVELSAKTDFLMSYPSIDVDGPPSPTNAYTYLAGFGLLPPHVHRSFEDRITGVRRGVAFSVDEVVFSTFRTDGHQKRALIFHIEHPTRFTGKTIIGRSRVLEGMPRSDGLKFLDLNSAKLQYAFSLYTTDQVEARQLLPPNRMERLIALEKRFGDRALRGVFYKQSLSIIVDTMNLFELGPAFTDVSRPDLFCQFLSETGFICDLIDGFYADELMLESNPHQSIQTQKPYYA